MCHTCLYTMNLVLLLLLRFGHKPILEPILGVENSDLAAEALKSRSLVCLSNPLCQASNAAWTIEGFQSHSLQLAERWRVVRLRPFRFVCVPNTCAMSSLAMAE